MIIPDKPDQYGNDNLRKNKHIIDIVAQQPIDPFHPGDPFGQRKRAPRIQQDTRSPNKDIFDGYMRFLALLGMKNPSVIHGTVHYASNYRACKSSIKIENTQRLCQKNRQ